MPALLRCSILRDPIGFSLQSSTELLHRGAVSAILLPLEPRRSGNRLSPDVPMAHKPPEQLSTNLGLLTADGLIAVTALVCPLPSGQTAIQFP